MSERDLAEQMVEFARKDGCFSAKMQDAKIVHPDATTNAEVFLAI